MSDFEFERIGREHEKRNNLLPYPVVVGDGSTPCNILDPDIPGNILVRYVISQNLFQPISVGAPTSKMNLRPGQAVELETDNYGDLRIKGYDNKAAMTGGDSPYANVVDTAKVRQQDMATLLPQPTQPASRTVLVKGWVPILDNIRTAYPGGSIDLTSVIPGAGEQAWIVIALLSDFETLTAVTSTPVPLSDDLDQDDAIQECLDQLTTDDTKIWALLLSDDQSAITQQDFDLGEDERQAINTGAGSGSTPVTDVTASSPLASSGGTTPNISISNQSANTVLAGPTSGGAAAPAFRALVDDDIPAALTLVGGSANNMPIGASTANTGRFTTIEANGSITQIIGGQSAIITHAVTATRTITLPDQTVTLVGYNASSQIIVPAGTKLMPASDSTTALNIANAAGTSLFIVDTTNSGIGIGTADSTARLNVTDTLVNESSTHFGGRFVITANPVGTPAASTTYRGLQVQMVTASGAADDFSASGVALIGAQFQAAHQGTGVLANLLGLRMFASVTSTGNVSNSTAFSCQLENTSTATITNGFALDIATPVNSGGGVYTTAYGIRVQNQTAATTNYAIHTSIGRVSVLGSETIASAAGATWNGIEFRASTATITGSTNITTAAGFNYINIAQPTLSAASALTVTNAATLYIANAPAGGGAGPATITNAYALWVDAGVSRFDGGIAIDGATAVNVTSGVYTPTLTNVANLDASTAYECQYMRVGNTVTVSGKVDVDPTAAVSTQLGISLPVASNLGAAEDCAGCAFASGIAGQGAAILGDAANNRAQMQWIAVDLTNQAMYFTFSYQVI